MGIRAVFEHAYLAALEANRRRSMANPRPSSKDVAAELHRLGWEGTPTDALALARELGARLADSDE